jgi:hypothetical protein
MMPERASRTFICSVLFLDIVEYSRKPVAEQIRLKDRFNGLIAAAIREIPAADRIILDTGDGVAINFLGDPEDALFVAMSLRDAFAPDPEQIPEVPARIGINLGPVRLVRDLNGQPNIIGDGINVAQRVMAFARAGQILVSRSYYEIVSHISEGYTKLFSYEGSRTDKHVREHEIYSVGYSTADDGLKSPAERARRVADESRGRATAGNAATARLLYQLERWLGNRSLAYGTTAFSSLAFALALLSSFIGESPRADERAYEASPATSVADASGVTNVGTVSDKEPVLVATAPADPEKAEVAEAQPEEQESAVPSERKKRKLRLPFFNKSEPEPAREQAPEVSANAAAPEASSASSGPAAGDSEARSADETETGMEDQVPMALAAEGRQVAAVERATVMLAIAPWGEVYVDGKRIGVSPPVNQVEVPAGRRTIEIRNGDFPPYTEQVELKAQQKIKIRYKFN